MTEIALILRTITDSREYERELQYQLQYRHPHYIYFAVGASEPTQKNTLRIRFVENKRFLKLT